jgi:hypothetical protein
MSLDIRWEKRDVESDGNRRRTSLVASLMETVQESGLKRNRVIANLGAIETRFLNVAIKCTREFHQGLFWVHAKKKLDDLSLEIEVRAFIEAALAETVPKPGDDWALWGVKCIPQFDR